MNKLIFSFLRFSFRSLNRLLKELGLVLSKPDIVHGSPAFSGALVLSRRMFQTKMLLGKVEDVEGDVFEGGVHWGYGLLIELLLSDKHIHAFDSFAGHSAASNPDKLSAAFKPLDSSFAVTIDDVRKTLRYGSNLTEREIESRVSFVGGWIQDTLPIWRSSMEERGRKLAYVHADMDLYDPIRVILFETFPLLSSGALVVVGRLGNPELLGKDQAFKEFLASIPAGTIDIFEHPIVDTNGSESMLTYFRRK